MKYILPILTLSFFAIVHVGAQDVYDINDSGTWMTPGTWSPSGPPLAADSIEVRNIPGNRTVQLPGDETNATTDGTYLISSILFDNDDHNTSFIGVGNTGAPTLNIAGNLEKKGDATLLFQNRPGGGNISVNVGGNLIVEDGLLDFGITGNFGFRELQVTGTTTVMSDATLQIRTIAVNNSFGSATNLEEGASLILALGGNRTFTLGALHGAGDITVRTLDSNNRVGTLVFDSGSGNHLHSGSITRDPGTGQLELRMTKNGAGRQTLTGEIVNGMNGLTQINAGVLEFSGDSSLTTGNIQLVGGILGLGVGNLSRDLGSGAGQIRLTAANSGFAAYGDNRSVEFQGGSPISWGQTGFTPGSNLALGHSTSTHTVTLTNAINLDGASRTITVGNGAAEVDAALSGVISGTGSSSALVVTGGGTLRLTGDNTYAGGTTVNAGTLLVNNTAGSGTGSGAVTVAAGATLGGTGTIAGATTISGRLSPGNSIGTLTIENDVTWNFTTGNEWVFELGAAGLDLSTPGISDFLNITGGTSDFLMGTGSDFTFDFVGTGQVGWYKLVEWGGTTTFDETDFAASNLFGSLTGDFVINDNALYLNVIPEPSSALLLLVGALALALRKRRIA